MQDNMFERQLFRIEVLYLLQIYFHYIYISMLGVLESRKKTTSPISPSSNMESVIQAQMLLKRSTAKEKRKNSDLGQMTSPGLAVWKLITNNASDHR